MKYTLKNTKTRRWSDVEVYLTTPDNKILASLQTNSGKLYVEAGVRLSRKLAATLIACHLYNELMADA